MTPRMVRTLLRSFHLTLAVAVGAIVYLPTAWVDPVRPVLGAIVVPAVVITGVGMWQQGRVRRLVRRRRAGRPTRNAARPGSASS